MVGETRTTLALMSEYMVGGQPKHPINSWTSGLAAWSRSVHQLTQVLRGAWCSSWAQECSCTLAGGLLTLQCLPVMCFILVEQFEFSLLQCLPVMCFILVEQFEFSLLQRSAAAPAAQAPTLLKRAL